MELIKTKTRKKQNNDSYTYPADVPSEPSLAQERLPGLDWFLYNFISKYFTHFLTKFLSELNPSSSSN